MINNRKEIVVKRNESGLTRRTRPVCSTLIKEQVEREHQMKQNAGTGATYTHYKAFYDGIMGDQNIPHDVKQTHFRKARSAAISWGMQQPDAFRDPGVEFTAEDPDEYDTSTRDYPAEKWEKETLPSQAEVDTFMRPEKPNPENEKLFGDRVGQRCTMKNINKGICYSGEVDESDVGQAIGVPEADDQKEYKPERWEDPLGNVCDSWNTVGEYCFNSDEEPSYSALERDVVDILDGKDVEAEDSPKQKYRQYGGKGGSFSLNSCGLKLRTRKITRESVSASDDLHHDNEDAPQQQGLVVDDGGIACDSKRLQRDTMGKNKCPRNE